MLTTSDQSIALEVQAITSGSSTVPYRLPLEFNPMPVLPYIPTFPGPVIHPYPDLDKIMVETEKMDESFKGVLELVAGAGKDWVRMKRLEEAIIEMLMIELEPGEEVSLSWFIG